MFRYALIVILFGLALSGCASRSIKEVLPPVEPDLPLSEARSSQEQSVGKWIRWGGTIVQVTNLEQATEIELVVRPLDDDLSPSEGDVSFGRVIARIGEFLDPELYAKGREMTVRGRISAWREGEIGQYPYSFPVVDVDTYHLWAVEQPARPQPFYYDPWFDDPWPFYPPYYRGRYYPW